VNIVLLMCLLCFIILQGCRQQVSSVNEDGFKNYANSNQTVNSTSATDSTLAVNSSTSEAQPDSKEQPATLVNAAF